MRRSRIIAIIAAVLLMPACSSGPETGPEAGAELLAAAAEAMGGWEALEAVQRQEVTTSGNDWDPVQAPAPGEELMINDFEQTTLIDYSNGSMRVDFAGERSYPAPGPVAFTEVINGDAGAVVMTTPTGETTASRMQASRRVTRLRDLRRSPRQVLLSARDAGDVTRAEDRTIDGRTYEVLQYTDEGSAVELLIDPATSLPSRVSYLETDPLYGDVRNDLAFDDWRDATVLAEGGETLTIQFPYDQRLLWDGQRMREETVQNVVLNGAPDSEAVAIPAEVTAVPDPGEPVVSQWTLRRAVMGTGTAGYAESGQTAVLTEVAPGVFHATGGSHHSMVVEMADHLIVVEAPLFEERSEAVIAAARERFPDKPIRYAVVTHFHMDHSGGIRTYAAAGATVVGHESIVPFLNGVLTRPSTVRPDALAEASGGSTSVEGVPDTREFTDGTRTLQLLHVPSGHAEGMLIAYLPQERIAFVSDLYSPPAPVPADNANARAFYQAVVEAGLDVDQVLGGHGTGPGPFAALASVMGGS